MTPAIVAAATSGEVPTRPIPVPAPERAGMREVFQSWGRDPGELQWGEEHGTSLADLAASVLPNLTRNRSLSTLILATATPDARPTSQPSVAVLREHITHDRAIDLPAAWSITEQGMLAPLTALRVGCRRARRLTGDVVVIAADRVGLPYEAEVSVFQAVSAARALGVVISDSLDPYSVAIAPCSELSRLCVEAVQLAGPVDRVVVGGASLPGQHAELAAFGKTIDTVAPGQPSSGVLAEAVKASGRVLIVIADPDQSLVGVASIRVR